MEIWQNQSPLFCCTVKEQCIFVDLLQIKDKFYNCQESIIHGVSAYKRERERKQTKTPIFIFKSVRIRLQESVRLQECINTEFDWEVEWGFEQVSVSRAVRLRECPLAESWLYCSTAFIWMAALLGFQMQKLELPCTAYMY